MFHIWVVRRAKYLATSRGASIPVRILRGLAVKLLDDLFGKMRHVIERGRGEVLE
jgi:hypothetical protein